MKPIQRVKLFIDSLGLSISKFEKETGMSNNSIQAAIKRNANLKDETLNSILNTYVNLNPAWLLTGKGEMFVKKDVEKQISAADFSLEDEPEIVAINELINQIKEDPANSAEKLEELRNDVLKLFSLNAKLKNRLIEVTHLTDKL